MIKMNKILKYNLIGLVIGFVLWFIFTELVKDNACGQIECVFIPDTYFYFLLPFAFLISFAVFNLVLIEQNSKRIFNIKILPVAVISGYLLAKLFWIMSRLVFGIVSRIKGVGLISFIFDSVGSFLLGSFFILFVLWFSKKKSLTVKSILIDTCFGLAVGFFINFILIIIFNKFLHSPFGILLIDQFSVSNILFKPYLISVNESRIVFFLGWIIMSAIWIIAKVSKRKFNNKND